ncbi:hypothetical protein PF005_g24001 [Phytophthora fragariae]|nr:hypothetical protein PF009_g26080 [Phytophthora fragariae]KAE8979581.1 hypothetical protein PF011_g22784 [Phytophthora fragariae]KAE9074694.1 hypothetical protein PF007_g25306 [Phytophthora fragariae]KAE9077417.1 hypothetical protein PF010_g23512 [Phytophthora fragariae]KAE9092786.1 hypothetical protein PF006_g24600 [Phytophthora fragariae]
MDRDDRVGDAELGFPTLSTLERGDIHVLVRLPGDGPTTQPNPPAAEVAVPVEITSRVEGAPVKEQDTPAGVLRWCSTVLGSTLGWISASKSSSLSLETKKNQ